VVQAGTVRDNPAVMRRSSVHRSQRVRRTVAIEGVEDIDAIAIRE
jgi:hypothetical protein